MANPLLTRLSVITACALAWSGCMVHKAETPDLAGPSEFALSFGLTATPDAISHDGGSQSTIAVKAYDANGKPKPSVRFRLDMFVGSTPADYGTLSVKEVVTAADGRATVVYTAPPPPPAGTNVPTCSPNVITPELPGACLSIVATPIGTGFVSARSEFVGIRLIPVGVILPPAATPTADFTFSPATPAANTPVQFDASASCAGPKVGGSCPAEVGRPSSYAWSFSDGGTATGRVASHSFPRAGTYAATLTVTNDRGVNDSATKSITVGSGAAPTASFVYSPTPVQVGAETYFDASGSRPGVGHSIDSYSWNWGDGESAPPSSSPLQQHDYLAAGSYTVVLTVTDESGQIGTTTQTISVGASTPVAAFTMNPSPATVGVPVTFNGAPSTSPLPIARYEWNFDAVGGTIPIQSTTPPTTSIAYAYAVAGSYTVRLTVFDTSGVSTSTTHVLLVQ